MHIHLLKLILIAVLILGTAQAEIQFVGILTSADKSLYGLTDTSTGSSSWVAIGRTFAGAEVVSFDPSNKKLTLRSGDKTTEIALQAVTIGSAVVANKPATEAEQFQLAYKLALEGNQKIADLLVRYDEALAGVAAKLTEAQNAAASDPTNAAKAEAAKKLSLQTTSTHSALSFLKQQILSEVTKVTSSAKP